MFTKTGDTKTTHGYDCTDGGELRGDDTEKPTQKAM